MSSSRFGCSPAILLAFLHACPLPDVIADTCPSHCAAKSTWRDLQDMLVANCCPLHGTAKSIRSRPPDVFIIMPSKPLDNGIELSLPGREKRAERPGGSSTNALVIVCRQVFQRTNSVCVAPAHCCSNKSVGSPATDVLVVMPCKGRQSSNCHAVPGICGCG
mmetsp:Transcript_81431/g.242698  ORF Transcript_81431/g.242698 Transcript_81431/m.242698 type:complete len:162 (-) Transcript_81431:364-849(-)